MLLAIVQIVISGVLVTLILLQQPGAGGLGAAFGGESGGVSRARRGLQKTLFRATIVLSFAFLVSAFLRLFI